MNKSDIIKIIENNLQQYYIFPIDTKTSILIFFENYNPYLRFAETSCQISSYYVKSNQVYFLCKKICSELNQAGVNAEIYKEHNLKEIAFSKCGLTRGQNTLLYHKEYGSFFVIGAIKLGLSLANAKETCGTDCIKCKKCIKACPVSALNDGALDREKCLRQKMNSAIEDDESAKLLGNNILGCDICQTACPLNSGILPVKPEQNLENILNIADLIFNAEKGNKQLENLAGYIGKNYAKHTRILSLAINSAGNSKDKSYLPKIEKFKDSSVDAVRISAIRAIKLLNLN